MLTLSILVTLPVALKGNDSIPAYCFKGSFLHGEKDMASGRKGKAARAGSQQITLYSR